ncbi:MAG: hypothetical protein Q8O98_01785 [bacterium]|nr:hypothetical protein [bacterium]
MKNLAILVVIMAAFHMNAAACSCGRTAPYGASLGETIAAEYGAHDAIFVGEIVSVEHRIKRGFGLVEVTFRVARPIKNIREEDLVKVYTDDQGSACGLEEWLKGRKGEQWLIYSHIVVPDQIRGSYLKNFLPKTREHIYMASSCSRTAPVEIAAADIRYYNSLKRR